MLAIFVVPPRRVFAAVVIFWPVVLHEKVSRVLACLVAYVCAIFLMPIWVLALCDAVTVLALEWTLTTTVSILVLTANQVPGFATRFTYFPETVICVDLAAVVAAEIWVLYGTIRRRRF